MLLGRSKVLTERSELFSAASAALWFQREALEELLFTLVTEQLILTSGSARWLNRADAEVRAAVEAVQNGELLRAVEVDRVTERLGLSRESTLAQLAAAAPEPWSTLFGDHRVALRALCLDVHGVADENRRLLDAGARAARETLDRIGATVSTDASSGGAASHGLRGPVLWDEHA